MIPPKKPRNEARRLEVLWQYDILDTVPEEAFDDLTQLAASICRAPIASLSILDEHRQWFKAKFGMTREETARDISFCGHAILQSGLFIVPDARKDKRFAGNPLVTGDPHIRFYAGAPLITPDGHALGALCVIDQVPRQLTDDQKRALRTLANHTMLLLELRRQLRALQGKRPGHARLESEVAITRKKPKTRKSAATKKSARKR